MGCEILDLIGDIRSRTGMKSSKKTCARMACPQIAADESHLCPRHIKDDALEINRLLTYGSRDSLIHSIEWAQKCSIAWIYFIGNREAKTVKIGKSRSLMRRLKSLQNSSPVDLKLYAAVLAEEDVEKLLHKYLHKSRKHGEWFNWTGEIESIIRTVAAGDLPECIPARLFTHIPGADDYFYSEAA